MAIADKADYAVYVKDENARVSIPPAFGAAGNKLLKVYRRDQLAHERV